MSRTIPPLDLLWLLIESANAPTHVGAVIMFERPANGRPELVAQIVKSYRAAQPQPPFNHVPNLINVGMPQWRTVHDVDLDYHVQHLVLPPGATEESFLRLVEDLHEHMLDRNRPGFRMWFIEGLPNKQFAIYLKAHHSLVDGIAASTRIAASLAKTPGAKPLPPFFAVEVDTPRIRPSRDLLKRIVAMNQAAWRQTSALKDVSMNLGGKVLKRLLSKPAQGSLPFTAPRSPLNQMIRTARSFAMLNLPLAEMRDVGRAFGGTINDVAATVTDAALHRYLADLGKAPKAPLVAMCPVSLRDPGDTAAATKASAIFVPLGAPEASIAERMQQVVNALESGKDDMRSLSRDAGMLYGISLIGAATASEMSRLGPMTGRLASFILSNVPGGSDTAYLAGARVTGIYPISALAAGVGLNVTLASSGGRMGFGFVANRVALPDMTTLAAYTNEAFEELKAAAKPLSAKTGRPRVSKKSKRRVARAA